MLVYIYPSARESSYFVIFRTKLDVYSNVNIVELLTVKYYFSLTFNNSNFAYYMKSTEHRLM